MTLLRVSELTIRSAAGASILRGASVELERGRMLALVGGSGAGKTTLALAMLGYLRSGMRREGGEVEFDGERLFELSARCLRDLRRTKIAYLAQNPAAALTPTMRVEALIEERRAPGSESAAALLELVELPSDRSFLRRYPHQLSVGQQQRLALARAIANQPKMLILDEPTSAIDPTTQQLILALVQRLRDERGVAAVLISHDLASVARLADELLVLHQGETIERGDALRVLAEPGEEYSRALIRAAPDLARDAAPESTTPSVAAPLLEVDDLRAEHSVGRGRRRRAVVAAQELSFEIEAGETLALIGRSGSGKSTIARTIIGLHPAREGVVRLNGAALEGRIARRSRAERAAIQLVPQTPAASFNPRRSVGDGILRVLRRIHDLRGDRAQTRLAELLEQVQLEPALAERRPHQLSGGEQQRAAIARALAAEPQLLICDEITTALDTIVQRQITELLREIQRRSAISLLFITHDLALAHALAHRIGILREGRLVELAPIGQFSTGPAHPESRALLAAAPSLSRTIAERRRG